MIAPRIGERGEVSVEPLEFEREWWIATYLKLGYHKILRLTEKEYAASLPKFNPQSEVDRKRFDLPFIAETRIPPVIIAGLIGLDYPRGLTGFDWDQDPKGYQTPKIPYATWGQDGTKNLGVPDSVVRRNLAPDERCGTEFDAFPLYIKKGLGLLVHHTVSLPGTVFPGIDPTLDYAAYLSVDCGHPAICLGPADRPNFTWGAATCHR